MAIERYQTGFRQLTSATEQVNTMQEELTALQPVLADAQAKTGALLVEMEEKLPGVRRMKETVALETGAAEEEEKACNAIKDECEHDLSEALPALQDAQSALDTLKPADLTEVKSMKTPPAKVVLVLSAVCDMLGVKPDKLKKGEKRETAVGGYDYWAAAKSKKLLGDTKLIARLKAFDRDNISESVIARIRRDYIANPDFTPARVKASSFAAMGLCKWVVGMEKYEKIVKVVAPKKVKLAAAETALAATEALLSEKQADLAAVEGELQVRMRDEERSSYQVVHACCAREDRRIILTVVHVNM